MYGPHSLEQERSSWRTVIYFNVVRSIRQILSALETQDTVNDESGNAIGATDDANSGKSRGNGVSTFLLSSSITQSSPGSGSIAQSEATGHSTHLNETPTPIALLRLRLSHLVSMDSALADRLSGGIKISDSGKGGVYVRNGWQSRIIESAKTRQQPSTKQNQSAHSSHGIPCHLLVADVARMLKSSEDDIRELWNHPVVKDLIARKHLKLDEWSELYVFYISSGPRLQYLQLLASYLKSRRTRLPSNDRQVL